MLTQGEINHFDVFGFLVHRQAFDCAEMAALSVEFEAVCTHLLGHAPRAGDVLWEQPFAELSRELSRVVEDDRVYLPTQDLLGESMLWGDQKECGASTHWPSTTGTPMGVGCLNR